MLTTASVTVATLLESVGTVFTTAIGWVGKVGETIAGSPILLLGCVGIPPVWYRRCPLQAPAVQSRLIWRQKGVRRRSRRAPCLYEVRKL